MIMKPLYSRVTILAVALSMMMNTPQSVDSFAFSSYYSPKNSLFAKPTNKLSAAKKMKTAMEFYSPSMMLSGMMVDPMLEAEVLTDISHLGLDLATLLQPGRSSLLPIRIAAFVGRLLAISADYIPDHMVLPEEALFQLFMLGVTGWGIAQAALLPLFAHMANNVTIQDGKAYSRLFAPAGISWSDFKACRTLAMDWMTLEQHEEIRVTDDHDTDDDDYMYWLYSGELQVVASTTSNDKNATLYKMSSPPQKQQQLGNKNEAHGLLGELQLLASNMRYDDDKKTGTKQRGLTGSTTTTTGATTSSTPTVVVARATVPSTKVLRIHTPSLKRLMDSDKQFAAAVHNLMLQGMQSKLQAQLLLSSTSVNTTA